MSVRRQVPRSGLWCRAVLNGRGRGWRLAIAAAALCLAVSACGSPAEKPRKPEAKKQIMLVLKMQENDYWKTVRSGAEAAAKEFNAELIVAAAKNEEDIEGQIRLTEEAVHYKRDALVLAANDSRALAGAAHKAAASGMPVIAIDTEVASSGIRAFIGINHYEAGQKAGRKLAELTGGRGRVAVLSSKPDAGNNAQRERGFLDEIAKYPDMTVAGRNYCSSDLALCRVMVRSLIEDGGPLDGIGALHTWSSLGAAREVERLNAQGRIKVVAFDSTPEDIEYLQEGFIQATLVQNPFSMGYLGVKYAADALEGRPVPFRYDTGSTVIDRNNMFWADNQKLLFPFVQ